MNALEDGVRRGSKAISKEQVQRDRVDSRGSLESSRHTPHLGGKAHATVVDRVIDKFDTEPVSCQQKAATWSVPDCQAKHSIQTVENILTPLLVAMDNHFGVATCQKSVSKRFEIVAEFGKIVNLAVEDDPDRALAV